MALAFVDRLNVLGLDRFPEQDRAHLELVVRSNDEAAARIRYACGYAEEPSNVFRLSPVAGDRS